MSYYVNVLRSKFTYFIFRTVIIKSLKRLHRGGRPEVLCKKGVLKNCAKFTGKSLRQSLLFSKVTGLRLATLLKKRL